MSKLLTEQELHEILHEFGGEYSRLDATPGFHGDGQIALVDELLKTIQSQKQAHADMVIEAIDEFDRTASQKQMVRIQRERNKL